MDYYYTWYMILGAFETLICCLTWIPIIWTIKSIFAQKATNINFRVLLCYTVFEYQIIPTFRVLARNLRGINSDLFHWPIVISNVGQHWFLNQVVYSTLLLTIERTISTIFTCYENYGPLPSISVLIVLAIYMLNMTINLETFKNSFPNACQLCSISEAQPEFLIYGWVMGFAPMVITAAILVSLHCYNKHKRKNLTSPLNLKFQYEQNIYTTKCLIPISIIYAASCLPVLPLEYYTWKYTSIYGALDMRIRLCVLAVFTMFDFHSYLIIFFVVLKFPPVRAKLQLDLRKWGLAKSRVASDNYISDIQLAHQTATQTYFEQLELAWK